LGGHVVPLRVQREPCPGCKAGDADCHEATPAPCDGISGST
jgi:hypothetical protein